LLLHPLLWICLVAKSNLSCSPENSWSRIRSTWRKQRTWWVHGTRTLNIESSYRLELDQLLASCDRPCACLHDVISRTEAATYQLLVTCSPVNSWWLPIPSSSEARRRNETRTEVDLSK
jgi:hypothetical protein